VAPQGIEDLVLGDAVHPARRIVGHAAHAPRLQGVRERGLHHVLDQLEVPPAEDTRQHRHQAARLMAEKVLHQRNDPFRGPHGRYHTARIGIKSGTTEAQRHREERRRRAKRAYKPAGESLSLRGTSPAGSRLLGSPAGFAEPHPAAWTFFSVSLYLCGEESGLQLRRQPRQPPDLDLAPGGPAPATPGRVRPPRRWVPPYH